MGSKKPGRGRGADIEQDHDQNPQKKKERLMVRPGFFGHVYGLLPIIYIRGIPDLSPNITVYRMK